MEAEHILQTVESLVSTRKCSIHGYDGEPDRVRRWVMFRNVARQSWHCVRMMIGRTHTLVTLWNISSLLLVTGSSASVKIGWVKLECNGPRFDRSPCSRVTSLLCFFLYSIFSQAANIPPPTISAGKATSIEILSEECLAYSTRMPVKSSSENILSRGYS